MKKLWHFLIYPFIFWFWFIVEPFLISSLHSLNPPVFVGNLLFIFWFVFPGFVSGWIVSKRPIITALIGCLLNHILILIFSPLLTTLLLNTASTPVRQVYSGVPVHMLVLTFCVMIIIFFPITAVLAMISAWIGSRLSTLEPDKTFLKKRSRIDPHPHS